MTSRVSSFGAVFLLVNLFCGQVRAESLFDGSTLAGWHIMQVSEKDPYYATDENFYVEDGAIVCRQLDNQKGGLLLTDATFIDFELKLEFMSDWGCDSGVFIRCTDRGEGIQIMNDYLPGGNVGNLFGQGTGGYLSRPIQLEEESGRIVARDSYDGEEIDGLLYSIGAAAWNQVWKEGEWNALKIRCVGAEPRITTWVNGVKVMQMDGRVFRARHLKDTNQKNWNAPSTWDRESVQAITGNAGSVALQIHPGNRWKAGGVVRYRNIQITPLK
ncbi:DUF1080 domain-containing protein [Pelagicoccus enzymogenes]|uniref:3-keto-disaccharide hydrolase n=1 Tax=Pelagicoccus enzymogenes TaxID=2773457 RepID=UPI00280DC2B8|nr:DUF1080 domain-containing protein [Pelagicoccus enzymogenes]MDQ8196939.1 DUF1080 domain-containing protein [Pelagicoccus enzymogenes]